MVEVIQMFLQCGGEKYTKLDLSEAYLQIELEDEFKQYLVINTHRGLYRFN